MEGKIIRRSGTDRTANTDSDTSSLLLNYQYFVLNSFLVTKQPVFSVFFVTTFFLFTATFTQSILTQHRCYWVGGRGKRQPRRGGDRENKKDLGHDIGK